MLRDWRDAVCVTQVFALVCVGFLLVNTVIYFLSDIEIPERCLLKSSSASSSASHLQCAHISALILAHLPRWKTLAHRKRTPTLAHRKRTPTPASLRSARRNVLLFSNASRSAHPRTSNSFSFYLHLEGIRTIGSPSPTAPPSSSLQSLSWIQKKLSTLQPAVCVWWFLTVRGFLSESATPLPSGGTRESIAEPQEEKQQLFSRGPSEDSLAFFCVCLSPGQCFLPDEQLFLILHTLNKIQFFCVMVKMLSFF